MKNENIKKSLTEPEVKTDSKLVLELLDELIDKMKENLCENNFEHWVKQLVIPEYVISGAKGINSFYDTDTFRFKIIKPEFEETTIISILDLYFVVMELLKTHMIIMVNETAFGINDYELTSEDEENKNIVLKYQALTKNMILEKSDFDFIQEQSLISNNSNIKNAWGKYFYLYFSNNPITRENTKLLLNKYRNNFF